MFRHTITFLLIFLVANHEFAAARSVEFVPEKPIERLQKRDAVEKNLEGRHYFKKRKILNIVRMSCTYNLKFCFRFSANEFETGIVVAHSRTKREYSPYSCIFYQLFTKLIKKKQRKPLPCRWFISDKKLCKL
jgi:hypothetical protein